MDEIRLHTYLEQARAFIQDGKFLHATQIYQRLISEVPTLADSYLELASVYEEQNQFPAAEKILSKALERCSQTTKIIYRLGTLCLRLEQYDRAVAYYRLIERTKLPYVHFNLGLSYFYLGNLPRAEKHLYLTLKYDPHFPKINENIAELLIERKSYGEAVRYLRRAIQIDPYGATSHYHLGVAYSALYDWKNAYEEFVTAIEMDPKEVRAWESSGKALLSLGRLDEAEPYLRKALELDPTYADTLVDFGYLSLRKRRPDDAMNYFNRALKLQPNHPRAIDGRIQVKVVKKKQIRG